MLEFVCLLHVSRLLPFLGISPYKKYKFNSHFKTQPTIAQIRKSLLLPLANIHHYGNPFYRIIYLISWFQGIHDPKSRALSFISINLKP